MTQKELLYFEDAVGHLDNIIKILKNNLSNIKKKEIKELINNEIEKLKDLKCLLIDLLEVKTNG